MEVRIAENGVFHTLQGEGIFSGTPATFIRLQGCHRRCDWCDEPGALAKGLGNPVDAETVADLIVTSPYRDVVFTGGEPLLQGDALREVHNFVLNHYAKLGTFSYAKRWHLETAGDFYHPIVREFKVVTISPKLTTSGRFVTPHLRRSIQQFLDNQPQSQEIQLKFVISNPDGDILEILDLLSYQRLDALRKKPTVILQAEESVRPLVEDRITLMLLNDERLTQNRFPIRYMRRLHKDLDLR